MTTNFIIKNCPALDDQGRCFQGSVLLGTAFKECEEKDCLIKQAIEKCRKIECPCPDVGCCCYDCPTGHQRDFASEILQLFEIEEVDNK